MAAPKKKAKRGAKASRSRFRAKPKKKPAKPKAKTKAKAKAKRKKAVVARHMFVQPGQSRVLGELSIPSGKLAIFDIGLMGYMPREALEPAIVTCTVPSDRV